MNREELLALHKDTSDICRHIMKLKNQDYSGGSNDIFANFESVTILGLDTKLGILVRTLDKIMRINAFIVNGKLAVQNESIDDAIHDIINYMILLKGMIKKELALSETNNKVKN